jgi:hypothetical protein
MTEKHGERDQPRRTMKSREMTYAVIKMPVVVGVIEEEFPWGSSMCGVA